MNEVKIIGLQVNKRLGILKACKLSFDENDKLIIIKGEVGAGKSTLQTAQKLTTQGSKTLNDKDLFASEIDIETQLMDGTLPVFVGCKKNKSGDLVYTLYTKDDNGKVVRDPIIDGVKATPAKYLEALQTELTWDMNKLTSDNQTVQKTIMLKLYQHELIKHGVIFDSKHPKYNESILGRIDRAVAVRDMKDFQRKQVGGIAEDLKDKHKVDVNRPDTCPKYTDVSAIEQQIKDVEKAKLTSELNAKSDREKVIADIRLKLQQVENEILKYNQSLTDEYNANVKEAEKFNAAQKIQVDIIIICKEHNTHLKELGYTGLEVTNWIDTLPKPEPDMVVSAPAYLTKEESKELKDLQQLLDEAMNEPIVTDVTGYITQVEDLKAQLESVAENNRLAKAVESFNEWKISNDTVQQLKNEYLKMLASVDTGVDGLRIVPDEAGDIYMMYNGAYDTKYFNNQEKEYRKLSSYSGTQKPVICLIIQNYLLSKKTKALRYLFIDNIPIDKKTRALLESICSDLNLTLFVNITGDFEKSGLKDGEILIENGEVFFN